MKNMRALLWFGLLAVMLALTGCANTTCDGRGPSEICGLHHGFMHEEMVSNPHRPPASQEYLQARSLSFPHSYPFALPDQCDKCMVYICDDCVRAEREWRRQHPGEK
jgi:hypothetical protein